MHYYLEFGGGLGDIFNQMFHRGAYNVLRDLKPEDTARVVLITHNPHARELFDYHPKRGQFTLEDLGYWHGEEANREGRARHNLPTHWELPEKEKVISFYPAPSDADCIRHVNACAPDGRYIVIAATAGEMDRTLPQTVLDSVVREICEAGFWPVLVGKNYVRHGRRELLPTPTDRAAWLNCIDDLSVPGTALLLQNAAGLVTCHSSLNLLGWHLNKPQLLLYPESVLNRHIRHRDQWAFGVGRADCVHGLFESYTPEMVGEFVARSATGKQGRRG